MLNRKHSVTLSLAVCIFFTVVLTAGLAVGPWFVRVWFCSYRGWAEDSEALQKMLKLFNLCFYPCAVFAYITLYSLIRLLLNIGNDVIFVTQNISCLRRISWCCFAVACITGAAGFWYVPFFFMSVPAAFVGLMLRVVKNVMQNALELKTENELTI